jgi:hypothetical protein
LPGSLNLKNPGSPHRVDLLEMPGHRYDLGQIGMALDRMGVPPSSALTPASEPRLSRRGEVNQPVVDAGRIQFLWRVLPDWVRTLIKVGKRPGDRYRSRSEADCAVMRVLLDAGATFNEIAWIFASNIPGIGARHAEQGDRYLSLTFDFLERTAAPDSLVAVERVAHRGWGSRVVLDLRVFFGPHTGTTFQHGVESNRSVWPYLFLSAGLPPAPRADAAKALALWDRDLRVVLEEVPFMGNPRLQIKRFLPQLLEQ